MASIEDLPIELRRRLMSYLPAKAQMAAAEASRLFSDATDIHVAVHTHFKVRPEKLYLCLVLDEFDCTTATKIALSTYKTVEVIICKNIMERPTCEQQRRLVNWFHDATNDAKMLFQTIELTGNIAMCACRIAELTRYGGNRE